MRTASRLMAGRPGLLLSSERMISPGRLLAAYCLLLTAVSMAVAQTPSPAASPRWIEIQNATLNLRHRHVEDTSGRVGTTQVQHRETLRGRFKFDARGRYFVHGGVSTGTQFRSGWDNTPAGPAPAQRNMALRALYAAAQPIAGFEGELGGLYLVKGESTEITAYDEDGYVTGERVSIRRPRQVYFDEIALTHGFLTADVDLLAATSRFRYFDDPNYRQILVRKVFGPRLRASADYTTVSGDATWREAVRVGVRETRVVDTLLVEAYQRTRRAPDSGFAVTVEKGFSSALAVSGGYASIDPRHDGLNGDRFHLGKRVFTNIVYTISPEVSVTAFFTRVVGSNPPLPQRSMRNVMLTFNALPVLKRTGFF